MKVSLTKWLSEWLAKHSPRKPKKPCCRSQLIVEGDLIVRQEQRVHLKDEEGRESRATLEVSADNHKDIKQK